MIIIRLILCAIVVLLVGCASNSDTIKVAIPVFHNATTEALGPEIYSEMKKYFREETGKRLVVKSITLDELAEFDPALLHLVGSDHVKLEPWERQAIDHQQLHGGTVLIENFRGEGRFTLSMRDQLKNLFIGYEDRVSTRSDIITGRKLPEGSKSNRRVEYRDTPRGRSRLLLRGFEFDSRYPVLLSYEDLSYGMQGKEGQLINGYVTEYARNLMLNILLEADQSKRSQLY